jgi:ABC-type dipeptide/oligopeptide/nickel transport system permease subunit
VPAAVVSTLDRTRARSFVPLQAFRGASMAVGGTIVAVFTLAGATGLVLLYVPGLKHLWTDQDLTATLKAPGSAGHLLGTDNLGRDLLYRLLAGIGVSFEIGLAVTAMSLLFGLVMGLCAGYFGRYVDGLISGLVDLTWGFPLILLAVMLAGIFGPGFASIVVAVGVLNWAGFARIIRAYALSIREREFVEAAHALGIPHRRILLRHFVPNVVAPTLVMGSYYIAVTIIVEAGVSFLGLGIQPPTPSLGQMIAEGRNYLGVSVWQAFVPGIAIALAVLGFNLLGDALRDVLDPRLSKPQA